MRKHLQWEVLAIMLVVVFASGASALTIIFSTSDNQFDSGVNNQGWWSNVYAADDLNDNYLVGRLGPNLPSLFNNFFSFDLSQLSQPAISATLEVYRRYAFSPDSYETLGLFDVETDAVTLNNNSGLYLEILEDLGTGTSYGEFAVPTSDSPDGTIAFELNEFGVADLNAAAGGWFSIGGTILSLSAGPGSEHVFALSQSSASGGPFPARLIVAVIPEPTTALLLGIGLAALALRRRLAA